MLPEETISHIMSDIESYEPLKNLALCSSQFHRITVPYLYSHVYLRDDRPSQLEGGIYKKTPSFIHLRNLTALLLRTPEYAQHVCRFTMREQFQTGRVSEESFEQKDAIWFEVDDVLKEAIKTYSHSKEEEAQWLRDVAEDGNEDALLGLLLPALVKLKRLDLAMKIGAKYFARLIKRVGRKEKPFDSSPSLSALTAIMNTVSDEDGMSPYYFALYFNLPTIRGIYSHRLASADNEEDNTVPELELAALEPGASSVTHLELKDCKLNGPDIIHMLRSPKALQTFIYELGSGMSYCGHNFSAILSGLETHKCSLENLWLDHPNGDEWRFDGEIDDTTPMTSFANFQVLRNVRIGTAFIFGERYHEVLGDEKRREYRCRLVEGLPSSIKTLRITRCEDHFERVLIAVEGLLEQMEQRFAHLKSIVLEAPWSYRQFGDMANILLEVLQLADTNGVVTAMDDETVGAAYFNPEWPERAWGMDENIEWAHGFNGLNTREIRKVVDIRHSRICS